MGTRQAIFAAVALAQDRLGDVVSARQRVARQFKVSEAAVRGMWHAWRRQMGL